MSEVLKCDGSKVNLLDFPKHEELALIARKRTDSIISDIAFKKISSITKALELAYIQGFTDAGTLPEPPKDSNERDWPEDFNQENGNYTNTCGCCELTFIGNKHRRRCRKCGEDK